MRLPVHGVQCDRVLLPVLHRAGGGVGMNTVIVYGRSDDLIEITGAVEEELYANLNEPTTIRFDDGLELEVEYGTDGKWRIETPYELPNDYSYICTVAPNLLGGLCDYSEKAVYQSWDGVNEVEKVE